MLITKMCVFLHVPKTGGTWVRQALRAAGVDFEEFDRPHAELSKCPCPEKFKFAFVRNPLTLYQSYWRFKMTDGWDIQNPFDRTCASASFRGFVENVLAKHSGWCSGKFESFVGKRGQEIEFIGRYENLTEDLVRALRLADESFNEQALRHAPPVNVSVWPAPDARWPEELIVPVAQSENEAMTRFGYLRSASRHDILIKAPGLGSADTVASKPTERHESHLKNAVNRQAILVLGMHRSGTSALTGLLQRLGVKGPNTPMPADEYNPLGYGESDTLAHFHDRLLHSVGNRWDEWKPFGPGWFNSPIAAQFLDECRSLLAQEFGDAPLFVVKDPRLCRLVPFWLRVFQIEGIAPAAVIAMRNPLEVARSLYARDQLPEKDSLLMWLRHLLDAEFETRAIPRSVARYPDFLRDWKAVANRMSDELGVAWPNRSSANETDITDFLRPELYRHAAGMEPLDVATPLSPWLRQTDAAFELLLQQEEKQTSSAFEMLDDVRQQFDRAVSVFAPMVEAGRNQAANLEVERHALRQRLSEGETERDRLLDRVGSLESERVALLEQVSNLQNHVSNLEHTLAGARHHVEALLDSASWRITAPLRAAARVLRRNSQNRSRGEP